MRDLNPADGSTMNQFETLEAAWGDLKEETGNWKTTAGNWEMTTGNGVKWRRFWGRRFQAHLQMQLA